MKRSYLPLNTDLKSEYRNLQILFTTEGGAYFFGIKADKYYVISDNGTLADFFETEETELAQLKIEYEFENRNEFYSFINNLIGEKNGQINFRFPEELL